MILPPNRFGRLLCSAGLAFQTHPVQNGRTFVLQGATTLTIYNDGATLWLGDPPSPIFKRKFDDIALKAGANPPKAPERAKSPKARGLARRKVKSRSSDSNSPPWD